MKPAPGTSGLMPVRGSSCGLRPNLDEMSEDVGFDFSQAKQLANTLSTESSVEHAEENTAKCHPSSQSFLPISSPEK